MLSVTPGAAPGAPLTAVTLTHLLAAPPPPQPPCSTPTPIAMTPHTVDGGDAMAAGALETTPPVAPLSAPSTPSTPASPGLIHGSTPLSQIGANPFPPPSDAALLHGKDIYRIKNHF